MGKIGTTELLVVLAIVLVIFGPKALPKLGRSLGKTLGSFRKGMNDSADDDDDDEEEAVVKKKEEKARRQEGGRRRGRGRRGRLIQNRILLGLLSSSIRYFRIKPSIFARRFPKRFSVVAASGRNKQSKTESPLVGRWGNAPYPEMLRYLFSEMFGLSLTAPSLLQKRNGR